MPFRSKAQQRFMFAKHPKMAEEFAKATPDISQLPEHIKKMANGGEVFNAPQGDWEALKAAISQNQNKPQIDPLEQTGETDPGHITSAVNSLASGMAAGSMLELPSMLKGLGEAGEIGLGKAPEMEGMGPKIEVFSKGVMGKGTPNQTTIWGVKGDPKEIAKLGFGEDPGSIPEHILKQHGLLPEKSISIPQDAPNTYAHGGEVVDSADKEFHSEMRKEGALMNIKPQGYSNGGIVEALKHLIKGDKTEASQANNIDPVVTSSDTMKGYADGGDVTDPADEIAQLLSGQGNALPFMQGAVQNAAMPADMNNAQQLGISGAFTPPASQQSVDNDFINKLNMGTAMAPQGSSQPSGLSQVAQTAQNMPSTNPSIYQGISAEDRAALMQKLLAQKASPGMLAASGVAGLGDAISNAFGKGGQHAQQDVRQAQSQNIQNQIGTIDTERQQKLQDLQANQEQALNDPNSPLSTSMRSTLKSAGLNVPSGMSGALMLKIAGPLGELALKQAMAGETERSHKAEEGQRAAVLQNKEETYASEHPFLNFFNPVGQHPTSPVSNTNLAGSVPQMGQTFNGEKVIGVKRIK